MNKTSLHVAGTAGAFLLAIAAWFHAGGSKPAAPVTGPSGPAAATTAASPVYPDGYRTLDQIMLADAQAFSAKNDAATTLRRAGLFIPGREASPSYFYAQGKVEYEKQWRNGDHTPGYVLPEGGAALVQYHAFIAALQQKSGLAIGESNPN